MSSMRIIHPEPGLEYTLWSECVWERHRFHEGSGQGCELVYAVIRLLKIPRAGVIWLRLFDAMLQAVVAAAALWLPEFL